MKTKHSQNITALFHNMLDAILNGETSFGELELAGKHQYKKCEFTLHQLYKCFAGLDMELATLTYTEFRKALFHSPVNEEMKKRGGGIEILENTGKVDESVYCLKIVIATDNNL